MIGEVMRECRNFFETGKLRGTFSVSGGMLDPSKGIVNGQFIAVTGSTFHDGVWVCDDGVLLNADTMHDETFEGEVFALHPPSDFIRLCSEIKAYTEQHPTDGVVSESFGAYSRTMATGKNGAVTWQEAFSDRLRPYRRMLSEVHL